ncbi:MAG: hypothetical protein KAT00_12400 [Planctomycetes bacterium]|nr:hypothetical protein [Planctomycetota bacterium]
MLARRSFFSMFRRGSTFVNSTGFQRVAPANAPIFPADFSAISSVAFAPQPKQGQCEPEPCEQWWTITATAREVTREAPGGVAMPLLQWSDINNSGQPGTDAQLLVRWEADAALVDIAAGCRFSVLAPAITVSVQVPSAGDRVITNQNSGGDGLTAAASALVKDTLVTIGASCSDSPIGTTNARLTRTYDLLQTDVQTINGPGAIVAQAALYRVPSRVRAVTFSVPETQAIPAAGTGILWNRGAPNAAGVATRLGLVDAWGARTSPRVAVPGGAGTFFLFGFAPGDIVTATWELDI